MRHQVLFLALAASVSANASAAERDVAGRADDSGDCLGNILKVLDDAPAVPAELEAITGTCVPSNLAAAVTSFSSHVASWYSELGAEMSDCPAYPTTAIPKESIPSISTCTGTGDKQGPSATGATPTATSTTRAKSIGTDATTTAKPSQSTGLAASGTASMQSQSTNAAAHESGVIIAAAAAVAAGLAVVAI